MLYQILFVGLGSFLGGILRFIGFSCLPFGNLGNLLWINLIGSFGIGILSEILITQEMRLMFIVGFLGSLTTFSTFSYELLQMLSLGKVLFAIGYWLVSTALGVLGVWCGVLAAKLL